MIMAAFVGSMICMGFVILMSKVTDQMSMLIVSGVMIGYICSAITDFVVTFADDADIVNLHNWSKGSFSGITWDNVVIMAIVVGITSICVFLMSKPISAYQMGESYAQNMGLNVQLFRILLVLLSSILSACVTAFAGPVSFVGIAVPHLVKNLFGTAKPIIMIPACFLGGSVFCLFDEATVAEAIDSRAFSEFCSVDSSNQVPDGDTLGRFRNLLIRNGLQEKLFAQVVAALMERGLILKKGTIVDSTIISAPSSTKNKEKKRDPDAHQVKKGNTWHFGYKAHIGVDKDSGLVHTVKATAANVHDVSETSKLLTGEEEAVYGDSGYLGAGKREDAVVRNKSGHKIKYKINRRPSQVKKLSKSGQYAAKKAEHAKSSVRAKVEHVFGVVKKQLHFRKTRYRGLEKQQAKFNIMFALANLILADRPCLAA